MPFVQKPASPEDSQRELVDTFINACMALRPNASTCTVDIEHTKLSVYWPATDETLTETYLPNYFDIVANAMMLRLAIDQPACVVLLDVELPSLRHMLKTDLALPHLKNLIIRVFPEAFSNDTWDLGVARGSPLLATVKIEEDRAIDYYESVLWVGASKLPDWVAHLGAPNAVITYKRYGQAPQGIAVVVDKYEKLIRKKPETDEEEE